MTRAKDISKIVTDADLSGTLDVTGTVTAGGLTVNAGASGNFGAVISSATSASSDALRLQRNGIAAQGMNITTGGEAVIFDSQNTGSGGLHSIFDFKSTDETTTKNILKINGKTNDISFYEDTGTTPKLFWDASAERLGLGTTSPSRVLHISHPTVGGMKLQATTDNYDAFVEFQTVDNNAFIGLDDSLNLLKINNDAGIGAYNHLVIDTSGNVGIGTDSPSDILHIKDASSTNVLIDAPTDNASLTLQCGSSDAGAEGAFVNFVQNTTSKWQMGMNTDNSFRWYNYNTSSEAMQIDSSGNLLVGKTAQGSATVCGEILANGTVIATRSGSTAGRFNRTTSDGNIVDFRKDNTVVGSIGVNSVYAYIGTPSVNTLIK